MKKQFYLIVFSIFLYFGWNLFALENNNLIIGTWVFESMTTTFYSDPQEIETVDKDDDYSETLIFGKDGTFNFEGSSAGEVDQGKGSWLTNGNQLTTIIKTEKTIGEYNVADGILTIITNEEETEQYFATKSVVVYKKL